MQVEAIDRGAQGRQSARAQALWARELGERAAALDGRRLEQRQRLVLVDRFFGGAGLRVVNAGAASGTTGITVLAPTEAGWRAFLAAAPGAGLKFGELAEAGRWWWGRSIPRNLLSGAEEDGDEDLASAA